MVCHIKFTIIILSCNARKRTPHQFLVCANAGIFLANIITV